MKSKASKNQPVIIPFDSKYKNALKELNYQWLERYFKIEPSDEKSLSNPKEEIIDKGGFIYYAKLHDEIVGCVALLKISDEVYELGKMAVADEAQGYGIGTLLLEHALEEAKNLSINKLILYSNTQLAPALHLYRKYGFVEVPLDPGLYDRADIKMELKFL